jgi:hypothetical protein
MTLYIVPIVEGQTEAGCVERLLQRVWTELLAGPVRLQVLAPSRGQRDALIRPTGTSLAEKIEEAHMKLSRRLRYDPSGRGLLLLLVDAEADCPAELGPRLLQTARRARSDADIACVLAKRMFENWIVAGASTLGGVNGLPDPLQPPDNPEDRSGEAWLEQQLRSQERTRHYKKTADAAVFVGRMSLDQCRARSPSFDKLCRELALRLPPSETAPPPETDTGQAPPA